MIRGLLIWIIFESFSYLLADSRVNYFRMKNFKIFQLKRDYKNKSLKQKVIAKLLLLYCLKF